MNQCASETIETNLTHVWCPSAKTIMFVFSYESHVRIYSDITNYNIHSTESNSSFLLFFN